MKRFTYAFLLVFSLFSSSLNASSIKHDFSREQLLSLSPFDEDIQKTVLQNIADFWARITLDFEAFPMVKIYSASQIRNSKVPLIPEEFLGQQEALTNGYFPWVNVILLEDDAKLHNLAHELMHFIQYNYMGFTIEDGCGDEAEEQAVWVQNSFRD